MVDVEVEKATHTDNDYVQAALENAEEVVGPIETVHMDGAYQSPENVEYGETHNINMVFTGIQGAKGRFAFIRTDQGLFVFDG